MYVQWGIMIQSVSKDLSCTKYQATSVKIYFFHCLSILYTTDRNKLLTIIFRGTVG